LPTASPSSVIVESSSSASVSRESIAAKTRDPRADERVRAFTERWAARAQELDPKEHTQQ
jgi:hypothetical protein